MKREFCHVTYRFDNHVFECEYTIYRDSVFESNIRADIGCSLTFKEALRALEFAKRDLISIKCSPDFWETLEFRAREW